MNDLRSSLQKLHEDRELQENLSSRTELAFGFHVLRQSKLDTDEFYETDLLSQEFISLQSLTYPVPETPNPASSIDHLIPDLSTCQVVFTKHHQVPCLSHISEVEGESESGLSKFQNIDETNPRRLNSVEKSQKTQKVEFEEHFHNLSRDRIFKKERTNNALYSHYNGSLTSKSLVTEFENGSKSSERGFKPNLSETRHEVRGALSQTNESEFHELTKGTSMEDDPVKDRMLLWNGHGWYNSPGLFGQGLTQMNGSSEFREPTYSKKQSDPNMDSFENLQMFENSGKKTGKNQQRFVVNESRFQRTTQFRKRSKFEGDLVDFSDEVPDKPEFRRLASIERPVDDNFEIVNAESLDYSNRDYGKLTFGETNFEKLGFKKRLGDEKVESEGTVNCDTDRQQKSNSSNALFHKSSVKNIPLRDSGSAVSILRLASHKESESSKEGVNGLLDKENNPLGESHAIQTNNELGYQKQDSFPTDRLDLDKEQLLETANRNRMAVSNHLKSPPNTSSVTVRVTDLAMPSGSANSRINSRSLSSNSTSTNKEHKTINDNFPKNANQTRESISRIILNREIINCLKGANFRKEIDSENVAVCKVNESKDSSNQIGSQSLQTSQSKNQGILTHNFTNFQSPPNQKMFNLAHKNGSFHAPSSRKKSQTPAKTVPSVFTKKVFSKTPNMKRKKSDHLSVLLQNTSKMNQFYQKSNTNLFKNLFTHKSTHLVETENSIPIKSGYLVNSQLVENQNSFNREKLFSRSMVNGSRQNSTPPPKHISRISTEENIHKTHLEETLIHEIDQAISRRESRSELASQFALESISCGKGIRILRDLYLIDANNITGFECRLIQQMFTALDITKTRRVELREFKLFVLAIFGIQKTETWLSESQTPVETPLPFQRPSIYSLRTQFAPRHCKASSFQTGEQESVNQQNYKDLGDSQHPTEQKQIRYFDSQEITKIEFSFRRFRENRRSVFNSMSNSQDSRNSLQKSKKPVSVYSQNKQSNFSKLVFPEFAFQKSKNQRETTTMAGSSAQPPRSSTTTNPDSTYSHKNTQQKDLYSGSEFRTHMSVKSKSPFPKQGSSPNLIFGKIKKNYSVIDINKHRFLPFMKENNKMGNILKLEIVVGKDQVEEIYIEKDGLESVQSKVAKLQKKSNLDRKQCMVMHEIIQRELRALNWSNVD